MRHAALFVLALLLAPCAHAQGALVFAAASLREALDEVAGAFAAGRAGRVDVSYAASGALARQIARGAPADIFISADADWVDYLERERAAVPGTRRNLLANELVLIAPAASAVKVRLVPGVELAPLLRGARLAMADPQAVPAGKYGKAALTALGAWKDVEGRIAPTEHVRAALALVARGEAPLGIVYRTDALAEKGVRIVDTFPGESHAPIVYPMVVLKHASSPTATAFAGFLATPEARAIFQRHGFRAP
jgi:molybdate transport system substrate-binding protein